jgi:hypothetical protein
MKIDLMTILAITLLTNRCLNLGKHGWLNIVSNDVYINGSNDSSSVANAFASHFSKVYRPIRNASSDTDDIKLLLDGYSGKELNDLAVVKLINVEVVDNCLCRLKLSKASAWSGPSFCAAFS